MVRYHNDLRMVLHLKVYDLQRFHTHQPVYLINQFLYCQSSTDAVIVRLIIDEVKRQFFFLEPFFIEHVQKCLYGRVFLQGSFHASSFLCSKTHFILKSSDVDRQLRIGMMPSCRKCVFNRPLQSRAA